jgi:hypothetical protein
MAARGVHFAITEDQADALLEAEGDDDTLLDLVEEIEEAWDEDNLAESDKAWDAMHRCLTDGRLEYGSGAYPLNHCVLAPRQLHEGDDYIVCLVLPKEVKDVVVALEAVSPEWFDGQYASVLPKDYALEYGSEDREYTWEYFESVRELFRKAGARGRAVVFTVDQ